MKWEIPVRLPPTYHNRVFTKTPINKIGAPYTLWLRFSHPTKHCFYFHFVQSSALSLVYKLHQTTLVTLLFLKFYLSPLNFPSFWPYQKWGFAGTIVWLEVEYIEHNLISQVVQNSSDDRSHLCRRVLVLPTDIFFWIMWKITQFTCFTGTIVWVEGKYFEPCRDGYECFSRLASDHTYVEHLNLLILSLLLSQTCVIMFVFPGMKLLLYF